MIEDGAQILDFFSRFDTQFRSDRFIFCRVVIFCRFFTEPEKSMTADEISFIISVNLEFGRQTRRTSPLDNRFGANRFDASPNIRASRKIPHSPDRPLARLSQHALETGERRLNRVLFGALWWKQARSGVDRLDHCSRNRPLVA